MKEKIAIIGGGNLGGAMTEGLLRSGRYEAAQIVLTRRRVELLAEFSAAGVRVSADNVSAAAEATLVVLAVQPAQVEGTLAELKHVLQARRPMIISAVTGVSCTELETFVGPGVPIVRAAPNTAVAIGQSATCVTFFNCNAEETMRAQTFLNALGQTFVVPEELMAAATVIDACGVAYALRYIRAISQAGVEIGFDAELAGAIAAQTVKGAAQLLLENGRHPEEEIDRVTTPKGCTITGLNEMEHEGFSSSIIKGVVKSFSRIAHLK